jgi:predicted transcriptional regulator
MKISPRPPQTPLQDSILVLLQGSPRTKQELSAILNRPSTRIMRALRSLLIQEKIRQQIGEEVKYQLFASDLSNPMSREKLR